MKARSTGLILLTFLLVSFPLSGKGQGDQKEAIPVRYVSHFGDPQYKYEEMELISRFEDRMPRYKVLLKAIPYEEYDHTLKTYLFSASDKIDVLMAEPGFLLNQLVQKGHVKDLRPSLEKLDPEGRRKGSFLQYSVNREGLFYLPVSSYSWGIYYKPSLFIRLGLDVPENWEEFLELCENLKKSDLTPLALGSRYSWTVEAWFDYLDIRLNGPEFHEKLMAGESSLQNERVQHVLDKWKGLADAGYFPENAGTLSWIDALELFENEQAGMYLMGDFIRTALHPGKRDDLDFFPFPRIEKNIPSAEISPSEGYIVPSGAEHPEGAVELIGFLLNQKNRPPSKKNFNSSELDLKIQELIQSADLLIQVYEKEINPERDPPWNIFSSLPGF